MLSFGDVYDRSVGAALRGAVGVVLGMLKVRAPRLPKEEPPPGRAQASPANPSASAPVRININNLGRNAMGAILKRGRCLDPRPLYGHEIQKGKGGASRLPGVRSEFRTAGRGLGSSAHPVAYSRGVVEKLKACGFNECRANVLVIDVVRHAVLVHRWATPPVAKKFKRIDEFSADCRRQLPKPPFYLRGVPFE